MGSSFARAVTADVLIAMGAAVWVIVIGGVVVVGIVVALFGWDRYGGARKRRTRKRRTRNGGLQPTDEVFLDPSTGRTTRVWYDAATGERQYRPE